METAPKTIRLQNVKRGLAPLVVLTGVVTGFYMVSLWLGACSVQAVEDAAQALLRQRDRFDHSYQFATSASPNNIVRPVAELQQILRDTRAVEVPPCMRTSKDELLGYMGTVIRAFAAYGAEESDEVVRKLVGESETHHQAFRAELNTVRECAPLCLP